MSDLSPHAAEFSPRGDDYDDDFDDDSFEDDAPQQLSPISEAVPPSTPMSPRDEASLDAREEFIRRWRAKEAEADAGMRVVDQSRKPIDRTILPAPPPVEPMHIEGGDAAAAREEARQLRDQLSLIRKESVVHPSQQDESPRVAQLLREKETLLEEVAARDRAVASLENQLGDSEKKVVFLERHLSKLDHALESLHRDAESNASEHEADADAASAASPVMEKEPVQTSEVSLVARDELDIARAALQGAEAREKEVRDERDKALQRCELLLEEKRELETKVINARRRAEEAVEARIVDAVNARMKGESTAVADERVAMLSEELDRARSDAVVYAAAAARDAARDGVELRDANDALEEKLEASLRLQAMAEARAETAQHELEACRQSSRQTKEADDERISELEERLAVAEGLHADASRQVTEKSQEVEKMNSSSKALGDEADDTRKELEDVVREKNDLRRRVVEAEQSVLDSRRVLEAQVQKLEGQLSQSEARVLSLEKDMAERAVARLEALPETAGAVQAAHEDRLAAAALRAEAAADRALAQQARSGAAAARSDAAQDASSPKLLEPRGYDFVEAAALPENADAAALRENAPTLALGAAWAQTASISRAARDDRAAAAAQREAADRDRAAAARDRSAAAKELAEAHMERESAAARGREDAQASQDDVRKLAWRIVSRVTRRHQEQSLRSVFDALRPEKRMDGRRWAVLGVAIAEQGRRGRRATLRRAWKALLIDKPPELEIADLADPEERKRRVDAAARRASMAAEAAAAARGDLEGLNREEPDASKAIVFQRSKDAPGGVVGVDGQAVCSAFQFGGCAHQSQTGLVVHQKPDGSTQWLWHACVACARASGQLRTHARFGDIRSCPLSADVAVPCKTKPLGDSSNKDVQDTLSKHREDMIRRYAGERDDLMAALGAALTNLHSIGASYPRWIWERYERGRTAAVPAWAYTSKSSL
jgi:uncharacterized coiled-coil protein SlyX